MKGIILAGGKGTRLYPMTKAISKQLIPVYDKPMIYYSLSVFLIAKIKEILLISTPEDIGQYKKLLGSGSDFGITIEYKIQERPRGLADAFILGEKFIGSDSVCLVLGDNIFYGSDFDKKLFQAKENAEKGIATIFAYGVKNPSEFGIVEFDDEGRAVSIEEKPKNPKSNFAVPGLYFYDNSVIGVAKNIEMSRRGELEITSVNNYYLEKGRLNVVQFGRGFAWLDTGTPMGLSNASEYVKAVQERTGTYVSALEEIAYRNGFITGEKLKEIGMSLKTTEYGKYLLELS
jgi:glucose-1-phosphate thymidylyltransferase